MDRKSRFSTLAGIAIALACPCVSSASPTFELCPGGTVEKVTTQADEMTSGDGLLSLREAVEDPPTDSCDIVELPAGRYPITSEQGGVIPIAAKNVEIRPEPPATARDVVIDGGGANLLFRVGSTASANFVDVDLTNGIGAIANEGGFTVLEGVTVTGNRGRELGGGVYNSASGIMDVNESTLSDNAAGGAHGGAGGGLYNEGDLDMSGSTISGNSASGNESAGGGIYNGGSAILEYLTLDHNTAAGAEAIAGDIDAAGKSTEIVGSLLGGGSPENCNTQLTQAVGHNISSDSTCFATAEDPELGPLQNNGGPTDTEMLLPGSPAIDASSAPCEDHFDQRGVSRPQGGGCDVGAYELVQTADLGVSGSAAPDSVNEGSQVAFTFDVNSSAPTLDPSVANDAVQPTLTDVLPAGLKFLAGSPGCSANGQTVTCDLPSVADNAGPAPVTISTQAVGLSSISNTATVSSPRPDSDTGDDSATVTVTSNGPPPLTQTLPPIAAPVPQQPQASVSLIGISKIAGDSASVRLACSGSPCLGTATASGVERLLGVKLLAVSASRHKAKARKKPVTVGTTSFSIPPGQIRTVTIRLNATGRKLLTRFRTLPATLTIRLQSVPSALIAARVPVTFRLRTPRPRHR
jgi:hypothetical protein